MSLKKQSLIWMLYDWAITPYSTIIVTFIFTPYFVQAIAPSVVHGTATMGYINAGAGVLVALVAIYIGCYPENRIQHKKAIIMCTLGAALSAFALFWVMPQESYWLWAVIWFGVGLFFSELVMVFYNALLRYCFPSHRYAFLSGWGLCFSYLGGLGCLTLLLGVDALNITTISLPRLACFFVFAWILIFSSPFLFGFHAPSCTEQKIGSESSSLKASCQTLLTYPAICRFLLARLLFIDGINTMLAFAGTYAVGVYQVPIHDILLFAIEVNLAAGLGSALFSRLDQRFGSRRVLSISLLVLVGASSAMLWAHTFLLFSLFGLLFGLVYGPVQSTSRSFFCQLTPAKLSTKMFGFYAFSGRITAFLGPLLLATVTEVTRSQRLGMGVPVLMAALGWVVLQSVPKPANGSPAGKTTTEPLISALSADSSEDCSGPQA